MVCFVSHFYPWLWEPSEYAMFCYAFMPLQKLFHLHSFNKHLLSADCGQGIVIASGDTVGEENTPEF